MIEKWGKQLFIFELLRIHVLNVAYILTATQFKIKYVVNEFICSPYSSYYRIMNLIKYIQISTQEIMEIGDLTM